MTTAAPYSAVEPVTEILHGSPITDSYRWLEEQSSPRTREWLAAQAQYSRTCLDAIPGRERIRERIRELLDIETCDSLQKVGNRYVFRKRAPRQEQPCIFLREGTVGEEKLLIDPADRGTGSHTAVRPLCISPDGRLLLYEVKEGGERTGTFELLNIEALKTLPDVLPRGYLRGFAFAPDCLSFYYVHEAVVGGGRGFHKGAYRHVLGTNLIDDREIFSAGEGERLQLCIVPGEEQIGFLSFWFSDKTYTNFWVWRLDGEQAPIPVITNAEYHFRPVIHGNQILANTDRDAPNSRIVEVRPREGQEAELLDVIPATDSKILDWAVTENRIFVSYIRGVKTQILTFDRCGRQIGPLPIDDGETVRFIGGIAGSDELLVEQESFLKPIYIYCYSPRSNSRTLFSKRDLPFDARNFSHKQVWFTAKDGTRVPMFLAGRRNTLEDGPCPTIMTSYGGYGVSMTPQFSVFVAYLMERGCLFALPNIRGGCEFGVEWHNAARRRNRQVAFDDFTASAEWLINTRRTEPERLAIFGGSNSGLLVGAALTQRPDLFCAVLCLAPLLDMLRYHLFDNALVWQEEFGTADDPEDFAALKRYSPYHQVRDGVKYPATMIVSGDADQNCNPLHARKMTARLQAANINGCPVILDYGRFRGHSPVLPLSQRVEALTDRLAFLCDQLRLEI